MIQAIELKAAFGMLQVQCVAVNQIVDDVLLETAPEQSRQANNARRWKFIANECFEIIPVSAISVVFLRLNRGAFIDAGWDAVNIDGRDQDKLPGLNLPKAGHQALKIGEIAVWILIRFPFR